jgi:hypothetical protein
MKLMVNGKLLDSEFSVSPGHGKQTFFVTLKAAGEGRNTEYAPSLEAILIRLQGLQGIITNACVISGPALKVDSNGLQIPLTTFSYPIELSQTPDFGSLRNELTQGQTGLASNAKGGGGNARKKMRLEVLIPGFNEEESSLVGGFLFSGKY